MLLCEHETLVNILGPEISALTVCTHLVLGLLFCLVGLNYFLRATLQAITWQARFTWGSLSFMFPFCAFTGYWMTALAVWYPEIAYPVKIGSSFVLICLCCVFLFAARKQQLKAVDSLQKEEDLKAVIQTHPGEALKRLKDLL